MKKLLIFVMCSEVVLFSILLIPKPVIATGFTPSHLFDGYYSWNSPILPDGHYNSDINLTINEAPTTESYYYWSKTFYFKDGEVGYIGLQTNGWMWNQGWVGKMAIFSIWNAIDSQPGEHAMCGKFDGEGEGLSCRMKYNWQVGHTYRLRVWKVDTSWWAAFIMDITTGKENYLGKIKVSSSWKGLTNNFVLFSEYFREVNSCDAIPHAIVTFSHPMADNDTYTAKLEKQRLSQKCEYILSMNELNNSWHIETGKANVSSNNKTSDEKSNIARAATECYGQQILTLESCIGDEVDSEESRLHQLINEYRAQHGLSAIPTSPSLSLVANRHIRDLVNNIALYSRDGENWLHGWSDCAYDAHNQETYACMWQAPQRLGTTYPDYGYENLCGSPEYPNYMMTADYALECWQGSSAHDAVILNQNIWETHPWNALGIGIYKGYAVLWFGEAVDSETSTTAPNHQILPTDNVDTSEPLPTSQGQIWQIPQEPHSDQGDIPIDRFRPDDGNLWKNPLRFQAQGGLFLDTAGVNQYDATRFTPDGYRYALEGFFQIRHACQASWYSGRQDLDWMPANIVGAIEYCVYPENIAEVVKHLRATADRLACSAGLETCQ